MVQLLFIILTCAVSFQASESALYQTCKETDGTFKGNVMREMTLPSRLGCFLRCSRDSTCKSLNVCPRPGSVWRCELMDNYSPWFCRDLTPPPETPDQCFHAEKTSRCQNGGRLKSNGSCKCDLCFMGKNCEQHARDCQEAVEELKADGGYWKAASCYVKPNTSPDPILVLCPFGNSKMTDAVLRVQTKTGLSSLKWDQFLWNDFKYAMSDNRIYNFFMGLENLHHFLAQAMYRLNLFNVYFKNNFTAEQPSFRNLTIGDETQNYALSYSVYTNSDVESDLDLESFQGANISHRFCTKDRDYGNCAETEGPGWYFVNENGSCVGNSPFAPIAMWSYNGTLLTIKETHYSLERVGNFY